MTPEAAPVLSVVSAALNEAASLRPMHARLADALGSAGVPFEWIVVDDGSDDGTSDVVRDLAAADPRVRGVRLSRRFGQQAALLAGLRAARGRAVVTMDADLQHPPECVPALVALWRSGHEVVVTTRRDSADAGPVKRLTSRAFYAVFRKASGLDLRPGSADFCLLDRRAVEAVLAFGGERLFLRGAVRWIGFRRAEFAYDAADRLAGRSGYSFRRMFALAMDGIFGYSAAPTRLLFGVCGAFVAGIVAYGAWVVAALVRGDVVPGWTSIVLVLLALGAVLCLGLGVLGEYAWRIYGEVRRLPSYVVAETFGAGTTRGSDGDAARPRSVAEPHDPGATS